MIRNPDPNLARVVEATRKQQGLTQVKLAARTGLALGTITRAEAGFASTRTLNVLSRALGMPVDELTGRSTRSGEGDE